MTRENEKPWFCRFTSLHDTCIETAVLVTRIQMPARSLPEKLSLRSRPQHIWRLRITLAAKDLATKAARGNSRKDSIFSHSRYSPLITQRAQTTIGEENLDIRIAENSTRREISAHPAKQTRFEVGTSTLDHQPLVCK